jgi:hypothetical protein
MEKANGIGMPGISHQPEEKYNPASEALLFYK